MVLGKNVTIFDWEWGRNSAPRDRQKRPCMVFYLKSRFTNPIMSGIIFKSFLSSMLWHKFHEDIIMQTRK